MTFQSQLAPARLVELKYLANLTLPDILIPDTKTPMNERSYMYTTKRVARNLLDQTTCFDVATATELAIAIKLIAQCVTELAALMSAKFPATYISVDDPCVTRICELAQIWRRLLQGDGVSPTRLERDGLFFIAEPTAGREADGLFIRLWMHAARLLGAGEPHLALIASERASGGPWLANQQRSGATSAL